MADTLLCRGLDSGGTWSCGPIAFGYRRTAAVDILNGNQPMTVSKDGRLLAAVSYSGEIFNHRELRAELQRRGHHFHTHSDTEVALNAYLEWGVASAERLDGMYAFAVWDASAEELVLVRDRMGIKPLYYFRTPSGILFGSEPKALLAHDLVQPEVDLTGLREMLSPARTPGEAVFRGMAEVKPGHVLRTSRSSVREQSYWRLEARPHETCLAETVDTVRQKTGDSVRSQLHADVPLCVLLSGGIDSSSVAALAVRHLKNSGEGPLRTYSMSYAGYADDFHGDETRGSPDTPFAWEMAAHIGSEHREIELDIGEITAQDARASVLRAKDVPTPFGDMNTSLYQFLGKVRKDCAVALTGEAADEIFGGYAWEHDQDLVYADTFPWVAIGQKRADSLAFLGSGLLSESFLKHLNLGDYCNERYTEGLREVPELPGEAGHERRMREISYLHLTRWLPIVLEHGDRLSMARGLQVRMPYCDHRLVEYVFNAPWEMKSFDGREKSLLRAAMQDLLPEKISNRSKAPYPVSQDERYARSLQEELDSLLADSSAPVRELLDVSAARAIKDGGRSLSKGPGAWVARADIEMVLQLNAWLRDYRISLDI